MSSFYLSFLSGAYNTYVYVSHNAMYMFSIIRSSSSEPKWGLSLSLSLALHQLRKYTPRVPTRLDTHLHCPPKAVPLETKVGTLSMDTNYANIQRESLSHWNPPDIYGMLLTQKYSRNNLQMFDQKVDGPGRS